MDRKVFVICYPEKPLRFIRFTKYILPMHCPDCGYDADDAAIFCPRCRFQFRDIIEEEPVHGTGTIIDLPERGIIPDETVPEETEASGRVQAFSEKERRQLELQLLQPSVVVVLVVALFSYTVLGSVPFVPLSVAGMSLGTAGIICLACGIVAGLLFHYLEKRSIRNFRYQ
jgi:hypothetical protein